VSVRELKQYIAEHVRLDMQHAAAAAPLEFGETAKRVEEAQAQPGRGKKVVPITFSHYCPDGAKDPNERTYGATSWKKAENKDGEATCDYAVLGLVVAGEQYGASFKVCIARDRCKTHWREVVEAKEKAAKLREKGETKKAAKVEKKAEASMNRR
jgi:type IV secretory pathway VirJ component